MFMTSSSPLPHSIGVVQLPFLHHMTLSVPATEMGRTLILVSFICVLACNIYGDSTEATRKLSSIQYNPGCENDPICKRVSDSGSAPNLLYAYSVGNDTLHYFFSTVGAPTFLVAKTPGKKQESLNVSWTDFLSVNDTNVKNSVKLPNVNYAFAVVFTKLYEYNDTNDHADFTSIPNDEWNWNIRDFAKQFVWKGLNTTELNNPVTVRTNLSMTNIDESYISFDWKLFGNHDRNTEVPHLEHTINDTQFNFLINNWPTFCEKSRFGLELVMMGTDGVKHMTNIEESKSLDDEYTPGVFTMIDWSTQSKVLASDTDESKQLGGYLQWKPVVYLTEERSSQKQTQAKHYDTMKADHSVIKSMVPMRSLAMAFFGDQLNTMTLNATNISFGLPEDGFYAKSNYTVWSGSIGYGTPPQDEISILVIIVIAVGLGIPVVLIIFGGLIVCIKRRRSGKGENILVNVADGD
ncbi:glycosylated lysosomal membrane protein A isoform X2 [Lingula anatina]|uniref:Glycosylated lysosomal membrane protein A isoform X2 n=1 Tax=Lingula anatina TaxID=7574 RepID=A0A1S3I8J5_LINAN|nr:glycosylated lysosomal membrane protein A isoform X2 [Lingula anatina]|eukprot:XP_013394572.1 glycosylated lysosomal membrane protein A isoform X2 [Lingula anatina]